MTTHRKSVHAARLTSRMAVLAMRQPAVAFLLPIANPIFFGACFRAYILGRAHGQKITDRGYELHQLCPEEAGAR